LPVEGAAEAAEAAVAVAVAEHDRAVEHVRAAGP